MKILILVSFYNQFLQDFYTLHPETAKLNFESHRLLLMAQRFGASDAYSYNLSQLGVDVQEIVTNDDNLQRKWAKEHGFFIPPFPQIVGKAFRKFLNHDWRYRIIKKQVKQIRPDVLYIQEHNILSDPFIAELKPLVRLVVGQVASPIPRGRSYASYDLVLTSFRHFVPRFKQQGIESQYIRLGFDERILAECELRNHIKYDITFIGGLAKAHSERLDLLNKVASTLPIDIFGYGKQDLDPNSALYQHHHGPIWGLKMYQTLHASKLTLNKHIDAAENFANNLRLFEATGVGTCLITDAKDNIDELFRLDKEVVTYNTVDELVEKARYLLKHDEERVTIAKTGQRHTLEEHTWKHRMEELLRILERYI